MGNFLAANSEAIQALAALVSVLLLAPSLLVFVLNQLAQLRLSREENHKYVMDQYRAFLGQCIAHPALGLESGSPNPSLSPEQQLQRDILFDLLMTIYERAFLTYRDRLRTHWKRQWTGWEDYMEDYFARADYLEWFRRVMFEDATVVFAPGCTQYDRAFEAHVLQRIRPHYESALASGELERFKPSPSNEAHA